MPGRGLSELLNLSRRSWPKGFDPIQTGKLRGQALRRGPGSAEYPTLMDDLQDPALDRTTSDAFAQRGYDDPRLGGFATVQGHPDEGTLLRRWTFDPAYQRYLGVMMQGNNPHFPLIGQVETTARGKAAIMERLDPVPRGSHNERIIQDAQAYVSARQQGQPVKKGSMPNTMVDALDRLLDEHAQGGVDFDLHRGNFMQRPDGTLVITDPYTAVK